MQANGMTKQNTQFLFFIPERSLSYLKMQANGKHSLSYPFPYSFPYWLKTYKSFELHQYFSNFALCKTSG
jgi:hypothetical protein